jgi:hypothetical protein
MQGYSFGLWNLFVCGCSCSEKHRIPVHKKKKNGRRHPDWVGAESNPNLQQLIWEFPAPRNSKIEKKSRGAGPGHEPLLLEVLCVVLNRCLHAFRALWWATCSPPLHVTFCAFGVTLFRDCPDVFHRNFEDRVTSSNQLCSSGGEECNNLKNQLRDCPARSHFCMLEGSHLCCRGPAALEGRNRKRNEQHWK